MKPEAQRIAIAYACGWLNLRMEPTRDKIAGRDNTYLHGTAPAGAKWPDWFSPPFYLTDLNAMHEAEKGLKSHGNIEVDGAVYSSQYSLYVCKLIEVINNGEPYTWPMFGPSSEHIYCLIHATAPQRAEAFLRTIGKWVDSPPTQ